MFTLPRNPNPLETLVAHAGTQFVQNKVSENQMRRKAETIQKGLENINDQSSPLEVFRAIGALRIPEEDKQHLTKAYETVAKYKNQERESDLAERKFGFEKEKVGKELEVKKEEKELPKQKLEFEKQKFEKEHGLKAEAEKRKQDVYERVFGQPSPELSEQQAPLASSPKQVKQGAERLADDQIAQITTVDPNLGKVLQQQKAVLVKQKTEDHKDSAKFDEGLLQDYEQAVQQMEVIGDIRSSINSGKVSPGKISNLFRSISPTLANAFLNAEQGKIEASLPYLLEGWKQVFGVRLSDSDLAFLQRKLPDIGKSKEANEAVLGVLEKYAKQKIVKYEAGKSIKRENGGLRPLGYADNVIEKSNQLMKQLNDQGNRAKVEPGTAINPEIAEQYLEMNAWDPDKARQAAQEDGYAI